MEDSASACCRLRSPRRQQEDKTSFPSDARFSCNICLEAVTDPVVTQCGHLFCWPCLYQWLEPGMLPEERQGLGLPSSSSASLQYSSAAVAADTARRVCPVCKALCSVAMVVPIYVRNEEQQAEEEEEEEDNNNDIVGDVSAASTPPRTRSDAHRSDAHSSDIHSSDIHSQPQGLRRRHSRAASASSSSTESVVPARPAGGSSSPLRNRTLSSSSSDHNATTTNNAIMRTPIRNNTQSSLVQLHSPTRSPQTVYPGSLSRGIALTLQHYHHRNNNNNNNSSSSPSSTTSSQQQHHQQPNIPSLHRIMERQQQQHGGTDSPWNNNNNYNNNHQAFSQAPTDPEATEVLSRILLLLGSFVILCLLLF